MLKNIPQSWLTTILGALSIILSTSAGADNQEPGLELTRAEREWISRHPVIRVAPDPHFSPIEFFDAEGNLQGIAADYLSLLSKRLGIQFEILPVKSWDEAIDKGKSREADMFSAATRSAEREKYMRFTSPLVELPGVIIVGSDQKGTFDMSSLHNRKVAIVSSYIWQEWIARDYPQVNIVPVTDINTGLQKVAFGEVDAMVSSLAVASYYIRELGITNLRVAGPTGYWTRLAMATRKDWPQLNSILEKAIAGIDPQQRQEIINKWVYLEPESIFNNKNFRMAVYTGLTVITLIIAIVLFWNRSLRFVVRHKTEDLLASEARLKQFLDASFEGLMIHDHGKIVDISPGMTEIYGYSAEELMGKNLIEFVESGARDDLIRQMAIGNEGPYETKGLHKDGSIIPTAVRARSIERNGIEMRVVGLRDLTERKQAEQALHDSETLLKEAQVVAQLGHWQRDIMRDEVIWSDQIFRIYGYEPQSFKPTVKRFMHIIHQDDRKKVMQAFRNAVHQPVELDFRIIRADGTIRDVSGTARSKLNNRGQAIELFGIVQDITDRKREEQARQQLQHQLFHSQKMQAIGQLTGGIAHDFNNNLTSILGFTRLALKLNLDGGIGKLTNYLNHILHGGERARNMVEQMLTYSRDTSDEPGIQLLQPLIENALQLLRPSIPSNINIEQLLPDDLPHVKIDPTQFEQVVMNLCINARDAIEGHGAIVIELSLSAFDGEECSSCYESISGNYVELSIKDSGVGMSTATKSRIFEPFFTTKEVGSGTGMGLSIVHGIMHNCGGHIRISTAQGEGTIFHLLFPVAGKELTDEKPKLSKQTAPDNQSGQGVIMVVDDESLIVDYLKELLERTGFEVIPFTNSEGALIAFSQRPGGIDLVITDQTMPGMTGLELAKEILLLSPDIPIILCSGYSEHVDETIVKAAGITEYIKKPIDDVVLLGKIIELTAVMEPPST